MSLTFKNFCRISNLFQYDHRCNQILKVGFQTLRQSTVKTSLCQKLNGSIRGNCSKMQNTESANSIKTIVVCGPSGSGKTTLLSMLLMHYKDSFKFCVSHTTRKPRTGEDNGRAYHFVDINTFEEMIKQNKFVEYAKFSSNYYGTSYSELDVVRNSGRIPILDVDIRGVISLKNVGFDAKYVFITTPSFELLERNLRKRGSENEVSIQKRLTHAIEDIKTAEKVNFDLVIVNSELDSSFEKLKIFVLNDVKKLSTPNSTH